MKTLLILRHAKTQPDAPRGDHARELIERGLRDSRTMGLYIRERLGTPDAIVSSDAARARQTAQIVAEVSGFAGDLTIEPRIYDAGVRTLLDVVRGLPDGERVAIVGHNPGFEMLAGDLSADGSPVRLPTAGLAVLEFDVSRWEDVRQGRGQLREIVTPKLLSVAESADD
ncbi:MAG: histidine phosphatase family protein [Thermomicrobiales bacterium]